MKWYKHLSKSLNNPFIKQLMYEFGSDAYLVFFGTLEIYADNYIPSERYELRVKTRFLRDELLLSNSKLQKILTKISQNPDKENQWEVNFNDDEVCIFIPKFKKLVDNYTKDSTPKTCKELASDSQETFQPIKKKKEKKNKEEEEKERENVADKSAPSPCKFIKPSIIEITEYCKERNNLVSPISFFNFYESKGWKVGSQAMKDWKAAIRTWEQRDNQTKQEEKPWYEKSSIIS